MLPAFIHGREIIIESDHKISSSLRKQPNDTEDHQKSKVAGKAGGQKNTRQLVCRLSK